jgi:ABC-type antimicrobial peptide transport system permease subunit/pimeloyl-ACP methyl ester carboxylesterase
VTLFELAKKNIKGNFRNYLIHFVSMFVSVVTFYVFAALQYSAGMLEAIESSDSMRSVFMVAAAVLLLFVSVFMLYSNQFFTRKRKKEVGLYALLGFSKRTIGRMLFYENLLIGVLVLAAGIAAGSFLSKLFAMILMRLLEIDAGAGIAFSIPAVASTAVVFMTLILITSIQAYRLIYRYKLIELFRAESRGEQEPRASVAAAIAAVLCLGTGYGFGFRPFSTNGDILLNLGVIVSGMIAGTLLLFTSLVVFLLKSVRKNKRLFYNGMNLIIATNLLYRLKGNARTLSVISILSAVTLCAFSFGFSAYYGHEKTVRTLAPFSYMFMAQDEAFHQQADEIIRGDGAHPVIGKVELPVIHLKGESSSSIVLSERDKEAAEYPIKTISASAYNRAAEVLNLGRLRIDGDDRAVAVRPMYTDYGPEEYEGETITLELPDGPARLTISGMTTGRVVNWSYPDTMIVVSDSLFDRISRQKAPEHYIGYLVEDAKTARETADALAAIRTQESQLSVYYTEYRLGIEDAAFNVFILGFLGLVFLMATGSILYFKQMAEAAVDKPRYDTLKHIGASRKEIFASILKQNALIFLLPLAVGAGHYIVLFQWLKRLFGGLGGISLALPVLICVSVFLVIYAAYYAMTVHSIGKLMTGKSLRSIQYAVIAVSAVIVAAALALVLPEPSDRQDQAEKVRLELPAPSGQYPVGVTELHLADPDRPDPWVKDRSRELMISIWYPASRESGREAPYMQPGVADYYDQHVMPTIGIEPGRVDLAGIRTRAWLEAPVAESGEGWPVILYSPGASVPRSFGTVNVMELASRGYIVVALDHPYETYAVQFPDGRVITEGMPEFNAKTVLKLMDVRVDDVRLVLDRLTGLKRGVNPDHGQKALPEGLREALDLERVGIFGHSAGGAAAAQAIYEDPRIDAGIDMDGTMGYLPDHLLPVAENGLDRPFMLMFSGYNGEGEVDSHLTAADRNAFWKSSSGWKLDVTIPNGAHFTYTDHQYLLPELSNKLNLSRQVLYGSVGTADPADALAAQQAYIAAFFDLHLKGIPNVLLETSDPPYAEVKIVE